MRFIHEKSVIEAYPKNFTGIVTVLGFKEKENLKKYTKELKDKIKNVIDTEKMKKAVILWQETFVKMRAKPKYKSSLTAAHDFYKNHNRLYQINTIVDFYNHYSMVNMIPMGAYDLTKIKGDLHLTIAKKGMEFIGIGRKDVQKTKDNEVIYKDDEKVTCRYWNLKDSNLTKIEEDSQDIIFMFDIIAENSEEAEEIFGNIKNDFKDLFSEKYSRAGLTGKDISDIVNLKK